MLYNCIFPVVDARDLPPFYTNLNVDGITVDVHSIDVEGIGACLGINWDGKSQNWNEFVAYVQKELDYNFAKEWVYTSAPYGQGVMRALVVCYACGGYGDGKWYLEGRLVDHRVSVIPKRLSADQAVQKMKEGKNIVTVRPKLAEDVLKRVNWDKKPITPCKPKETKDEEMIPHYNFSEKGQLLYCWVWI